MIDEVKGMIYEVIGTNIIMVEKQIYIDGNVKYEVSILDTLKHEYISRRRANSGDYEEINNIIVSMKEELI